MNHRSVATTIILVVTTVIMGQENYQAQSVLPQHPVPSPNIDINGSPLGIWKSGGDLPLHGGTRKSDPFDLLLSNPLGSLDLSSLGSREARLRQWLADNSLSFDSLRAEFHPDPQHTGAQVKPPVHPSKPDLHWTVDPTHPQGKTSVIDTWLEGAKVLPAPRDLLLGFNNRFLGVNSDPFVHQGLVDKIPGVGQIFDTPNLAGSLPMSIVKDPVVKEVPLGNSYDGIRDPHVIGPVHGANHGAANLHPQGLTVPKVIDPIHGANHGAANLHPQGLTVPKVIDPILGAGHGAGKVDNLVVPGGLIHDPRRKPIGAFPTGY